MVTKRNGDWCPCGDYRKLNSVTVPDRYPVPHIQDCLQMLEGKKIFCTLDLAKAYHQIPVQDVSKTAVATPFGLFEFLYIPFGLFEFLYIPFGLFEFLYIPFGLFEFLYIPFGLSNAAATFQRFIHHVLSGMDFCVPYFDDVLVASESDIQHLEHLKQIFQRFEKYGVRLNASKCILVKSTVKFPGYIVTPDGITPLPEKVSAVTDLPEPSTVKELRRFLALINFYRRFVPNAARTQTVLNAYLKGAKKNDKTPITWTEEARNAFEKRKHHFAEVTVLYHLSANASRYVWPSMRADVTLWARTCLQCQQAKVSQHTRSKLSGFVPPSARFEHVHIDLVGPLLPSEGFRYCLTCVDRFSKWPEAFPLVDISANTIATAFYSGWISRFGPPLRLTTDQGTLFETALCQALTKFLGTARQRTTPYHPASNGQVE
ncbi:Retrovirus-related Pol polyprotein from transposon 297 [Araneus ventricosus]|uniref:RNA-directed DNA polymerase n=1 Tax=Araneus ventricosus TaxID=182803 RepID=A0A4Y2T2F1_ARAVE|nr:Retrovirus-related Pol polyprotein from transposon 297 [Araneus ventricosus]